MPFGHKSNMVLRFKIIFLYLYLRLYNYFTNKRINNLMIFIALLFFLDYPLRSHVSFQNLNQLQTKQGNNQI